MSVARGATVAVTAVFAVALATATRGETPAQPDRSQQAPPSAPSLPPTPPLAPIVTGDIPTFSRDVAPILYRHCTSCHRPGGSSPMSLLTFRAARPYARAIRDKVSAGEMPPWHADPRYGRFSNQRRLTETERDTLITWANSGSREGDPRDLPAAPVYEDTWAIGTPDLILSMDQEFEVPAEGVVDWQYFRLPTGLTEDRWLTAIEVRSSAPSVVHHADLLVRAPADRRADTLPRLVLVEPQFRDPAARVNAAWDAGEVLLITAAGTGAKRFPATAGRLLKAGSVITLNMHYTTNGMATKDRTRVAFTFAPHPPAEEIRVASFANGTFVIPPGAANHRVDAEMTFVEDTRLWTLWPHAHYRGKGYEYRAIYPDGRREILLSIPKYDFEWQTEYEFAEPLLMPKGTRLQATAYFDNSRANRANPDPRAEVRWGDQSWEEMMCTWLSYSAAAPPGRH
jgi:hypothetical protein